MRFFLDDEVYWMRIVWALLRVCDGMCPIFKWQTQHRKTAYTSKTLIAALGGLEFEVGRRIVHDFCDLDSICFTSICHGLAPASQGCC
jgi:hypothetical protein